MALLVIALSGMALSVMAPSALALSVGTAATSLPDGAPERVCRAPRASSSGKPADREEGGDGGGDGDAVLLRSMSGAGATTGDRVEGATSCGVGKSVAVCSPALPSPPALPAPLLIVALPWPTAFPSPLPLSSPSALPSRSTPTTTVRVTPGAAVAPAAAASTAGASAAAVSTADASAVASAAGSVDETTALDNAPELLFLLRDGERTRCGDAPGRVVLQVHGDINNKNNGQQTQRRLDLC